MKQTGVLILALIILLLSTTDLSAAKNRATPTAYVALVPFIFPIFQGAGQIYNGLYLKDNQ